MGTTSLDRQFYGSSVRAAAEKAAQMRKEADRLACEAWKKRMLASVALPSRLPRLVLP